MALYHNIRRPTTGEVKTVPWGELPAGWKPVNGIPIERDDEVVEEAAEEKWEFDGKEYKTEAAMKSAMTRAAKKEEAVEEEAEEAPEEESEEAGE
jgi:hypothetical protein